MTSTYTLPIELEFDVEFEYYPPTPPSYTEPGDGGCLDLLHVYFANTKHDVLEFLSPSMQETILNQALAAYKDDLEYQRECDEEARAEYHQELELFRDRVHTIRP